MRKFVKYVGKTNRLLMNGKCYEVKELDFRSDSYVLQYVEGKHSSYLFEEVSSRFMQEKAMYIAFSKEEPNLDKEIYVVRINKGKIEPVRISEIKDISYVGGDIYHIETENSIYITEITE